ncbi:hypothetical protein EXN54_19130 [Clostridium botulinum]|nr:hypothetical protein [Clostridium botulinum]NFA25858.1 hypothetical protein [Clostridium botulinum]NFB80775.1 hypothetical protein [Clostridium botulinum]NFB88660.1 hypothetical protein [Clostridium botulinum]NFE25073.1 hypothetical protein [Clostridium botulinum]
MFSTWSSVRSSRLFSFFIIFLPINLLVLFFISFPVSLFFILYLLLKYHLFLYFSITFIMSIIRSLFFLSSKFKLYLSFVLHNK